VFREKVSPSFLKYFMKFFLIIVVFALSPVLYAGIGINDVDFQVKLKEEFEQQKLHRIDQLKNKLIDLDNFENQYNIYSLLYNEYENYQYDSAYNYAKMMIETAKILKDESRIMESNLLMAYCCLSAGLFMEASEIARSIDTTGLNTNQKIILYSFYTKLYLDMAQSIGVEPYRRNYLQSSISYNEKIIQLLGGKKNSISSPYYVNIFRCNHQYSEAIDEIHKQLTDLTMDERIRTLNIGGLGYFYLMKNDTANAIPYLCEAAIADIKSVNKETPALCMLAGILYKQGDIERAYNYAKIALDDAIFFNARHRKIEVIDVLPIVDEIRFEIIKKQKNELLYYAILVSLLFVLLSGTVIIILFQMKRLRNARKFIQKQNDNLQEINNKLKESNHIKEAYIGNFFSINSAFIDKMEGMQKLVSRKILARQFDDLCQMFKNADIQIERDKLYASFDQIFLKLFPDFVNQYNLLFKEEDRVLLNKEDTLTTEMRIFALMRLGITNSERIAKILNYSLHTVRTYKTKTKNKALPSNDLFEQEIMKIETVKE